MPMFDSPALKSKVITLTLRPKKLKGEVSFDFIKDRLAPTPHHQVGASFSERDQARRIVSLASKP